MFIVLKQNGVVVAKGVNVYTVENGIYCDDVIYAEQGLILMETDIEVTPFKNTLINGVIGINSEWEIAELEKHTLERKVAQLEAENANINYALMMGGLI